MEEKKSEQPAEAEADEAAKETTQVASTAPANKPFWKQLGPGLITAAVVIGPGSITIASKVGAGAGPDLVWALAVAGGFMMLFTSMAARIGVLNDVSALTLMGRHYGKWLAIACGFLSFTVAAAFQSGNYVACGTALESLTGMSTGIWMGIVGAIALLFVFGAKKLYRSLEKVMTALVAVMIVCFILNLMIAIPMFGPAAVCVVVFIMSWRMKCRSTAIVAKTVAGIGAIALIATTPELSSIVGGLIPKMWPESMGGLVAGLTATTFSVIAALYQSTLAQQKGWKPGEVKIATREAMTGISVLVGVSLMIMMTSATVLRGEEIANAAGLAEQLSPLMGGAGKVVFSLGFLAAAFSSTVINAMIGGGLLADGFGLGSDVNSMKNRWFTTLAMAVGLAVGFYGLTNSDPLGAIVWAQRMTIVAVPLVAVTLVIMANDRRIVGEQRNRPWQNVVAGLAILVLLYFTWNKVMGIIESMQKAA